MGKTVSKLGLCIVCGDRVERSEDYIQSKEGYCHSSCVFA